MSVDVSWSEPAVSGSGRVQVSAHLQGSLLLPYATDAAGNPAPINVPYHYDVNHVTWRTFDINYLGKTVAMYLSRVYEANRKRS